MKTWMIIAALAMVLSVPCQAGNTTLIEDNATDILSGSPSLLVANTPTTSGPVRLRSSVSICLRYKISPVLSSGKTLTITPLYKETSSPIGSSAVPAFPTDAIVIHDTDCQDCTINFVPQMGAYDVRFKFTTTENATVTAQAGSK